MAIPAGRTVRFARIFAMVLSLTALPDPAPACLRDTLDARAVQWSTLIIRAKLIDAGKAQPIATLPPSDTTTTSPTTAPALPDGAAAPEAFLVAKFQVVQVIDGAVPGDAKEIRVLRLTAPKAKTASCSATLSGKQPGDGFVLLLRPLEQTELAGVSPGVLPEDVRREAFVVVHAVAAADADGSAVADLKQMVQDVRRAEATATEDAIKPQVDAVANAADQTEAEDAEKALMALGPRTVPALRAMIDGTSVNPTGRSRVKKMIEELSPPPLTAEKE